MVIFLNQTERTNKIFENNNLNKYRNSTKDKQTINQFIKANEYRNKIDQIKQKLEFLNKSEKENIKKFESELNIHGSQIKDLKVQKIFYQMKLKLFYLDILSEYKNPSLHDITASDIYLKLKAIKSNLNIK